MALLQIFVDASTSHRPHILYNAHTQTPLVYNTHTPLSHTVTLTVYSTSSPTTRKLKPIRQSQTRHPPTSALIHAHSRLSRVAVHSFKRSNYLQEVWLGLVTLLDLFRTTSMLILRSGFLYTMMLFDIYGFSGRPSCLIPKHHRLRNCRHFSPHRIHVLSTCSCGIRQ